MTKTHGLLRWKGLPIGFKNSSAYFQRAIEAALGGLRFTCCVVYIDDVVVHSKGSFEDHLTKVRATDASNVAMGAVLSQYDNNNVEHPVGYYSRKITDCETRWVIWELELGAAVWQQHFVDHTCEQSISNWSRTVRWLQPY